MYGIDETSHLIVVVFFLLLLLHLNALSEMYTYVFMRWFILPHMFKHKSYPSSSDAFLPNSVGGFEVLVECNENCRRKKWRRRTNRFNVRLVFHCRHLQSSTIVFTTKNEKLLLFKIANRHTHMRVKELCRGFSPSQIKTFSIPFKVLHFTIHSIHKCFAWRLC